MVSKTQKIIEKNTFISIFLYYMTTCIGKSIVAMHSGGIKSVCVVEFCVPKRDIFKCI